VVLKAVVYWVERRDWVDDALAEGGHEPKRVEIAPSPDHAAECCAGRPRVS